MLKWELKAYNLTFISIRPKADGDTSIFISPKTLPPPYIKRRCSMNKSLGARISLFLLILFLVFLSASCTSNTDMVITFDGNECKFEGPTEVEEGDQIVKEINTSGVLGRAHICRVGEGPVWQDTLDYIGEPGSEVDWPTYCLNTPNSSVVDADTNEVVKEYKLRFDGQYHVIWTYNNDPFLKWPCAPFEVIEAATE
jgi:hypothetical protein